MKEIGFTVDAGLIDRLGSECMPEHVRGDM